MKSVPGRPRSERKVGIGRVARANRPVIEAPKLADVKVFRPTRPAKAEPKTPPGWVPFRAPKLSAARREFVEETARAVARLFD